MTTTTVSSIPTKPPDSPWQSLRKEVCREIMNTDILCEMLYVPGQVSRAHQCMEQAFVMMRMFEAQYSRFKKDNQLYQLNQSERRVLSPELYDILTRAQHLYTATGGLFDPGILPALEHEGYTGAPHPLPHQHNITFSDLILEPGTLTAVKPKNLLIDLGGIGKGYIVDRVADMLTPHFENFLIDAGGDIMVKGVNKKENYPYWAVAVEHPKYPEETVALLLLSDMAVATSGRNRRHWQKDGEAKHHLIDPRTAKSATSDYLSVTVIAPDTTTADVLAKALFIAGTDRAPMLAEKWQTPAIFITDSGQVTINHHAQAYVWKAS